MNISKVDVKDSESKGRYMINTVDLKVGELVFAESSLIHASWHDHICIECDQKHDSTQCQIVINNYPTQIRANLEQVVNTLADMSAIGEIDRARLFIKCLVRVLSQGPQSELLQALNSLAAVHLHKALSCISQMRQSPLLATLLPSFLDDNSIATILSVLNTNSHELPGYGGSGVFLLASRMEHNCRPNCTFAPIGNEVKIYCLENIPAGSPLCLDYLGSDCYRPTSERINRLKVPTSSTPHIHPIYYPLSHTRSAAVAADIFLFCFTWQESYDFTCVCEACTVLPDLARVFVCPRRKCRKRIMPLGRGLRPQDWVCQGCKKVALPHGFLYPPRFPLFLCLSRSAQPPSRTIQRTTYSLHSYHVPAGEAVSEVMRHLCICG